MASVGWLVVPLCIALTGISVALAVPVATSVLNRSLRTSRIRAQVASLEKTGSLQLLASDLCRNGVRFLRPISRVLLKSGFVRKRITLIASPFMMRVDGINCQAICEALVAGSIVFAAAVYLVFGQLVLALVSILIPLLISSMRAEQWQLRQQELLREQLPDALRALGMCFSAGFTLQQAMEQTARETEMPLRAQLKATTHDMQTGCSVAEALSQLEQRTHLSDLQFVSVAMEIQHKTGGSMREILDSAADSINSSFDLARSMAVQTAQAKMSARVVSIMPLVLVLILSVVMDGYLATFFNSVTGFMLLVVALVMELFGILAIRKILGINLG